MIIFENKGTIDPRAIKTFGVNAKDDEASAIGYFGTGLKYAIAVLLRAGAKVSILSDGVTYELGHVETEVRGKTFDIVTMNDEELGFTTSLGKNWEMWMAFRELYSNTLDEDGEVYAAALLSDPNPEHTYVMVSRSEDFERCYKNRGSYFIRDADMTEVARARDIIILDGQYTGSIYYKGVRVMETRNKSLFAYNFLTGLKLTEDRTISGTWDITWELATAVKMLTDKKLIKKFVMCPDTHFEGGLNYMHGLNPSEEFLDTVQELRNKYKDIGINPSAIDCLKKHRDIVQDGLPTQSVPMSAIEQTQLKKAKRFCEKHLELDFEGMDIIVAKDLGPNNLGRANMEDSIIYISKQCFREGTKRVAVALLEEHTHVAHEVLDETVQQKWVYLNMITTLGEKLSGEPL
jgi:hypothetical protein